MLDIVIDDDYGTLSNILSVPHVYTIFELNLVHIKPIINGNFFNTPFFGVISKEDLHFWHTNKSVKNRKR